MLPHPACRRPQSQETAPAMEMNRAHEDEARGGHARVDSARALAVRLSHRRHAEDLARAAIDMQVQVQARHSPATDWYQLGRVVVGSDRTEEGQPSTRPPDGSRGIAGSKRGATTTHLLTLGETLEGQDRAPAIDGPTNGGRVPSSSDSHEIRPGKR
jgi:hypothetical protein